MDQNTPNGNNGNPTSTNRRHLCAFHGGPVAGPYVETNNDVFGDVCICSNCITDSYDLLSERGLLRNQGGVFQSRKNELKAILPREIFEILELTVIGQREAKICLSNALAKHVQKINNPSLGRKFNTMIFGPTGTGKTEMISTLTRIADLPYIEFDCSQLTPNGYQGASTSDILRSLFVQAGENIRDAERGIIYLDEFDKMARDSSDGFKSSMVQQEILKLIEGGEFEIKLSPQHPPIMISTKNIMFVASGAFVGLQEFVAKDRSIGIGGSVDFDKNENWQSQIRPEHLIKYGLIPELVGRFSSFGFTRSLQKEDIRRILTEPENSVTSYFVNLFEASGSGLVFEESFLQFLADRAVKEVTGVRSLQKMITDVVDPIYFKIDKYFGNVVHLYDDGLFYLSPIADTSLSAKDGVAVK